MTRRSLITSFLAVIGVRKLPAVAPPAATNADYLDVINRWRSYQITRAHLNDALTDNIFTESPLFYSLRRAPGVYNALVYGADEQGLYARDPNGTHRISQPFGPHHAAI
jgi:hypothetical protein